MSRKSTRRSESGTQEDLQRPAGDATTANMLDIVEKMPARLEKLETQHKALNEHEQALISEVENADRGSPPSTASWNPVPLSWHLSRI